MRNMSLLALMLLLSACTGQPEGVIAIKSFDANQYKRLAATSALTKTYFASINS